jgi:hypothetical protein
MVILFWFIQTAIALEVIRPEYTDDIVLKIIRAEPESFETYALTHVNGRVMTLVCAGNRVYDNNPKAFIEYRNYFNELAGNFTLENDRACREMGKFIEQAHFAVDESRPFLITLNRKKGQVSKIIYPKFDPLADEGDWQDLMVKPVPGIRTREEAKKPDWKNSPPALQ